MFRKYVIRMLSHAIKVKENGHSKNAFSWRYTLHSALLIFDLGIYFSNLRGPYIEQAISGEPEKKTSGKWDLNLQLQISVILCESFCNAGLS